MLRVVILAAENAKLSGRQVEIVINFIDDLIFFDGEVFLIPNES